MKKDLIIIKLVIINHIGKKILNFCLKLNNLNN